MSGTSAPAEVIEWRTDLSVDAWDSLVAQLGGHPLQTAMWGDARRVVDGIENHRWAAFDRDRPILLARFEVRSIPAIGRAAWLPRGPVVTTHAASLHASSELLNRLRSAGYLLCIDDRYARGVPAIPGATLLARPRTAWVDLTVGHAAVWKAIDPQWRYGVRRAGRYGVVVEQTRHPADVSTFAALCALISRQKKFDLALSQALLTALLAAGTPDASETRLFVARSAGKVAAGAAVLRSGRSLHYFWGAVDRAFAKQRPGEAVHGAIIEWALQNGIERYDLEGIDPVNNPGTYQFKMKMGAVEIDLPGRRAYPLNTLGKMALAVGKRLGRI